MKNRSSRLHSLDSLRGAIMILMALDHAVFFVAKRHPLEYWGHPLPQYQDALLFLRRLSSHLCAPGFFFLMGVSMVLFADSRRRRGWTEGRIMRHFVARGLLLALIQQFVVNPAWFLGAMGSTEMLKSAGPSGGGTVYFNLDVLYCIGACMIALALLLRAREMVVLAVSLGAILATQVLMPSPENVGSPYSPLLRLLLIPGQTGVLLVNYPLIPWLGVSGLGIVSGRLILRDRERACRWLPVAGAILLGLFATVRIIGGFGNFHPPDGSDWISFLNLTKYPPSLAFIALTLGVDLLLLAFLAKLALAEQHPLLIFGRTALFFYIVHMYAYALGGLLFPEGAASPIVYLIWFGGLALLYPLCSWYGDFERRKGTCSKSSGSDFQTSEV